MIFILKDLQGEHITFKVVSASPKLAKATGLRLDDWGHISFSGLDKGVIYFSEPFGLVKVRMELVPKSENNHQPPKTNGSEHNP